MTQKCLKATELCLSGLASGKRMFYMKYLSICYFWTMSVVKHSDQVDLIVVPHQPACGDVSVYCYWILVQLLLQPPDWGAAKKKPFIPAQNQPGQPAAQCISHISGVCVCGCVFCTLPLWELELCPSSILTHCTGPISTGTLSEQTSRLSHGEHGASL